MTVAAVVLAPPPVAALADEAGRPLVRGLVDAALAGGAIPIVVVSPDPDGRVAASLAEGAAFVLAPPTGTEPGIDWFGHGLATVLERVSGTTGALLWPGRYTWVDPETITSLIEAHGVRPGTILRPAYEGEPGFPVLLPAELAPELPSLAGLHGPEAIERLIAGGRSAASIELGDPGTVHDASRPRRELPPYLGPLAPASGHAHEWGAVAADRPDELR